MWGLTHQGIGHDFSRKLARIHTQACNSALIKGASAASHLSREPRRIIVQQLRQEVQGRYPKGSTEGERCSA